MTYNTYIQTAAHVDHVNEGLSNARPNDVSMRYVYILQLVFICQIWLSLGGQDHKITSVSVARSSHSHCIPTTFTQLSEYVKSSCNNPNEVYWATVWPNRVGVFQSHPLHLFRWSIHHFTLIIHEPYSQVQTLLQTNGFYCLFVFQCNFTLGSNSVYMHYCSIILVSSSVFLNDTFDGNPL